MVVLIEILLSVCMIQDIGRCKDVKLSYMSEDQITPHNCMINGQTEIAKWIEGNPNWQIMKWSCGHPSQLGKTI